MNWFALSGLAWSEPLPILEDWPEELKPGLGVYLLITSDADGHAIPVCRVCGRDKSGTLYIGQAKSLEWRVNELRKTLRRSEYSACHGAGLLLRDTRMHESFPIESLATRWALADAPREVEKELINSYVREFGEGPPLNRQRAISDHD